MKLGAYGKVPAYFAQIIQAVYLTRSNQEKHQMLQDAADQVARYVKVLNLDRSVRTSLDKLRSSLRA